MNELKDWRIKDLGGLLGRCESSLFADINRGRLMRPIKRGRSSIFPGHEVAAWRTVEAAGLGELALRQFVVDVHSARRSGDRIDAKQWLADYRDRQKHDAGEGKPEARAAPAGQRQPGFRRPQTPAEFIRRRRGQDGGGSR